MFKVGYKVVCVDNSGYAEGILREGEIYTVLETLPDKIRVSSLLNWWVNTRFELFVEAPENTPPALNPDQALRFNANKAELHYADMFPAAVEGVSRTLMYGTQRKVNPYPRFNWTKGAPYLELYNCARRHMMKWLNGEECDPDAQANGFDICHLDFAIGNLMRLRQQIADGRVEMDDRGYRPVPVKEADK